MTARLFHRAPGYPGTGKWRLVLLVVCLATSVFGVPSAAGDDDSRLTLGQPDLRNDNVWLDLTISGMFRGEVLDALHSGLPVTIVFEWRIWHCRDGWWDRRVDNGATYYRIFYDVLQNRYDVFDYRGRLVSSSDDSGEIERAISDGPGLKLVPERTLASDQKYYVEGLARIELLDEEEMRDFERWFTGPKQDKNGFDLIDAVSGRLSEMVGKRIGLDEKTVTNRTSDFFGFAE